MRDFAHLKQPFGRLIEVFGQSFRFFGGTSYLGLSVHPEFQRLFMEGVSIYGLNNGTSRNNNLQQDVFDQAEEVLSDWFGFASATLFSSGFLATQVAVKELSKEAEVYYAPGTHPALWLNGVAPAVLAPTFLEWSLKIVDLINTYPERNYLLITNALDNLGPQYYDFSPFLGLKSRGKVTLLIDDSHGISVGKALGSTVDTMRLAEIENTEVVLVASLAKSLATDAGLILSGKDLQRRLKKNPVFTGASPSSPAALYALTQAKELIVEQQQKLQQNITSFEAKLIDKGLCSFVPRFPVFTLKNPDIQPYLEKNKLLISSFSYPLPSDPLLNRIVLSSFHEEEDLQVLADVLHHFQEKHRK